MHWTDPFNERVTKANAYTTASFQLIRVLQSEGWTPDDIEALASPLAEHIRTSCKLVLQLHTDRKGDVNDF